MMDWLRSNIYVSGALALIRVYLGWAWLTAGWHKVTSGFDATQYLSNAINKPVTLCTENAASSGRNQGLA